MAPHTHLILNAPTLISATLHCILLITYTLPTYTTLNCHPLNNHLERNTTHFSVSVHTPQQEGTCQPAVMCKPTMTTYQVYIYRSAQSLQPAKKTQHSITPSSTTTHSLLIYHHPSTILLPQHSPTTTTLPWITGKRYCLHGTVILGFLSRVIDCYGIPGSRLYAY